MPDTWIEVLLHSGGRQAAIFLNIRRIVLIVDIISDIAMMKQVCVEVSIG